MSRGEILGVGEFQVCILLWWSMIILVFRIVTVIVDGVIACMKFLPRWRFVGFWQKFANPTLLRSENGRGLVAYKKDSSLSLFNMSITM